MIFNIKHKRSGKVLFSLNASSLQVCIQAAITSSANLRSANLRSADLSYADLSYANLRYADLSSADLSYANLRYADLSSANLRSTDLSYANLSYANLSYANLSYADLSYANLSYANLRHTKNADLVIAQTRILPEGDIIGWKKAGTHIVKLLIPADAQRSHAFGRKCRAEFVKVLEVFGGTRATTNTHGPTTLYIPGSVVKPDKWDNDFHNECSNGIHFFITREEAENY